MASPQTSIVVALDSSRVGKSLDDLNKSFKRSFTELNSFIRLTEKAFHALELAAGYLGDRVGKAFATQADTAAYSWESLNRGIEVALSKSPIIGKAIDELSSALQQMAEWLSRADFSAFVNKAVSAFADLVNAAAGALGVLDEIQTRYDLLTKGVHAEAIGGGKSARDILTDMGDRLSSLASGGAVQAPDLHRKPATDEARKKQLTEKQKIYDEYQKREMESRKSADALAWRIAEEQQNAENVQATRRLEMQQYFADQEASIAEEKRSRLDDISAAQEAQQRQWTERFIALGEEGIGGFFSTIGRAIGQGDNILESLGKFFGSMLQQLGEMLIAMGTASLLAATGSIPIPFLWPTTGGPAGVGGSLAIIAAGTALVAGGSAVSAAIGGSRSSGATSSAPSTPRVGTRDWDNRNLPASSSSGSSTTVINIEFNRPVGNPRRTAREIADMLAAGA